MRNGARFRGPGFRGLEHLAVGHEGVDQPGALRAVQALQEQLAFDAQAFVKGLLECNCHRLDYFSRREQAG